MNFRSESYLIAVNKSTRTSCCVLEFCPPAEGEQMFTGTQGNFSQVPWLLHRFAISLKTDNVDTKIRKWFWCILNKSCANTITADCPSDSQFISHSTQNSRASRPELCSASQAIMKNHWTVVWMTTNNIFKDLGFWISPNPSQCFSFLTSQNMPFKN